MPFSVTKPGRIEDMLTEGKEYCAPRPERQAGHHSQNADIAEYRRATGFESLLGYLFLTGQAEGCARLWETFWQSPDFIAISRPEPAKTA